MVERLKAAGRKEAVAHNRVYRPWGFYESLIQGDRFQVKRIVVTPGHKLRGHPETNESDSMRLSRSRISVA